MMSWMCFVRWSFCHQCQRADSSVKWNVKVLRADNLKWCLDATILGKKVGTVCLIWFKKSPPFPQCNVDPSHVARGRIKSANIDWWGVGKDMTNRELHGFFNPFLSAHIPYAQSEGILPKYGLLQWVEYISKSTQWISTKLCRDMIEALSFQETLKYWWPLTYIQGHVIQDGRQIHFSKSNLGLELPITQVIFGQIQ